MNMELRANIAKEFSLYNSLCYKGKIQDEMTSYYPTEAELMNIFSNPDHRKILRQQLSPELDGSLLYHMLNMESNTLTTPFWQQKILNYKNPEKASHTEADKWILDLKVNVKILHRIRHIQIRLEECIHHKDKCDVLCLGAAIVAGLPELHTENRNINICCIESDENFINELSVTYNAHPCIRKIVHGQYLHYYPDRKYDVIVYPAGQTWQETEKMQTLLMRLKNNLKPDTGRVLAY